MKFNIYNFLLFSLLYSKYTSIKRSAAYIYKGCRDIAVMKEKLQAVFSFGSKCYGPWTSNFISVHPKMLVLICINFNKRDWTVYIKNVSEFLSHIQKQSYLPKSIINSQLIYIDLKLESISYYLNERFAYGGSKHFLTEIDPYE